MKYRGSLLVVIFHFLCGSFLFAQTEFKIPNPPDVIYPVNDYANVLTPEQIQNLNDRLITYSDSTSTEIIVCTVRTLDGDDIKYVGAKWGEKWEIGQKGKNNGIVLLIAVDDRKLAIQNGRGTEDAMTDLVSGVIIRNYMIPYLKNNDYYGAINAGVDQIINVLAGKFQADPESDNNDTSTVVITLLAFVFIFLCFIYTNGNNSGTYYDHNGKRSYGGGFFGGGFGGGSFGGGFGGFGGGGSFGGGGASGSW